MKVIRYLKDYLRINECTHTKYINWYYKKQMMKMVYNTYGFAHYANHRALDNCLSEYIKYFKSIFNRIFK